MSDNIDMKMVEMACMADLSRHRQEELPLSDIAKRPTFEPRNSGADHIPQALKRRLGSKWSVKIQDEESEQMEGLTIEEDRPWAKFTNQYLKRHQTEAAPPRLALGSRQPRVERLTTPQYAPPTQISAPAPTQTGTLIPPKPQHVAGSISVSAKTVSAKTVPPQSSGPLASPSQDATECVLCRGQCRIISGFGKVKSSFPAEFAMKVQPKTSHAFLVLSAPDKGDRVHNILDLNVPDVQGLVCVISCPKGDFLYRLQFQKSSEAESFQNYFQILQQSAAHHTKSSSALTPVALAPAASPAISTPTAPLPTADKPQKAEEKIPSTAQLTAVQVPNGSGDASAVMTAKNESIMPVEKTNDKPAGSQPEGRLINIEDTSTTKEVVASEALTINDAADQLQALVQTILSKMNESGVAVSERAVDEVEDATIANWIGQGFLESESDDMKEELLQLLRVLVRIKRKAEFRRRAKIACSSPAIKELQRDQEVLEKKTARIQYSSEEIKRLEVKATPRQNRIEASDLLQKPPVQSPTSIKAQISAVSKQKDWLSGKTKVAKQAPNVLATESRQDGSSIYLSNTEMKPKVVLPEAKDKDKENLSTVSRQDGSFIFSDRKETQPTVALPAAKPQPRPFQGLATSRWAKQAAPTGWSVPTVKPTEASPKTTSRSGASELKGLSSSQWADKPVAFSGHFFGI